MLPFTWFRNRKAKVPPFHSENRSEMQSWCSEMLVPGGVKYSGQEDSSGETMSCSIVTNPMAATQDFQGSRQNLGACGSTATFYYLGYIRIKYIRQGGSGNQKSESMHLTLAWHGFVPALPQLATNVHGTSGYGIASCSTCLHLGLRGQAL